MSEVIPHKKVIDRTSKLRMYRSQVETIDFSIGERPVIVRLADGSEGRGTCLGCHNAPCMLFGPADAVLPETLTEFPGDPSQKVCPTEAIFWNDHGTTIAIDSNSCIGCGICVARCPYGAISLSDEGRAVVDDDDPDNLSVEFCETEEENNEEDAPGEKKGRIGRMDSVSIRAVPDKLANLNDLQNTQFIRNLLISCGIACRTRRRGDTNIRMDGVVGLADGRVGVVEIELTNAVLESPRSLLEDVAVLNGRYGIAVANIDPLSVILQLPNARSEYFQVISDIERVLNIRCRSLTVGALMACMWHFQRIDRFTDGLFITNPDGTDLWSAMGTEFSGTIPNIEPYPGAYRPVK